MNSMNRCDAILVAAMNTIITTCFFTNIFAMDFL